MDLSKYYAEICKIPMLKTEEEKELFKRFFATGTPEKEKEKIRDTIITANLRFAFKQAKWYSKNEPNAFADFVSAANEGLVVAFNKFDRSKDCKFLTYAGSWVMQRILDVMSKVRIVALPIWKQQLATKILRFIEGKETLPTLDEVKANFPEVPAKDISELYQTRYLTYYIEDLEEDEFIIDPIPEQLEKSLDNARVWKAVSKLPSPHREIVARSFGFEDEVEHSPAKMSKALKIPKEDIKRIKAEGLEMLREFLTP